MSEVISRAQPLGDIDHTGRIIEGIAYRWEHPSLVSDGGPQYLEEFARASADRSIAQRATRALGILHPWSPGARTSPIPIGSVTFHKAAEGLAFKGVFSRTSAGDEALELVKDGALGDVSVSARALRNTFRQSSRGRVTRREEIAIRELSLAPPGMGQHEGAQVLVMRSEQHQTPTLDQYQRRLRALLLTTPTA